MARYAHTSEPQKITPAQAKRWLANNHSNRSLSERIVLSYAADMEAEKWQVTGDPIRIGRDGDLLDGQHRLEACVLANVPFWTYVMENCDPLVKQVIDTGRRRTISDVLKMAGYVNTTALAAAINLGYRYDIGNVRSNMAVTHNQALRWLQENPGIVDSLQFTTGVRTRLRLIPQSIMSVLHYNASRGDREIADNFWKSLASGVGLSEREPVYAYRRWLERNFMDSRRASAIVQFAIGIKAFNAYVEGREVSAFTWKPAAGEEFPSIIIPDADELPPSEPGIKEAPPKVLEPQGQFKQAGQKDSTVHKATPAV